MADLFGKTVLVLGCGNRLFGDDGFGPEAVDHLNARFAVPNHAEAIDAGVGVRNILFDLVLSEEAAVRKVVIVDAVDAGREPGEIFDLDISALPEKKISDFSMHQLPTSNLLRELADLRGIEVKIIAAQVGLIPDLVRPGLSEALRRALPAVCERILEEAGGSSLSESSPISGPPD